MTPTSSLAGIGMACAALLAGALVPFQAGANAALGRALGHPLWAAFASLMVSLLVVLPALWGLRAQAPLLAQAAQMPLWSWLGGVAGVIYITAALVLTPRLGASGFIVCVIAGQVLASLLIDHHGLMGLTPKPATWSRVAGVLLIVVGMWVVQSATPAQPVAGDGASAANPDRT
ncbi:DMT family transporter [Aquabacterium sp. A7-Y]|uniref:DMT family transporter n=1 Tax=Aquabacterium sp. A7-Y TaxID=1349605 RepID=UPI00223D1217|nr:DMT family transporter [Aquabacterium sp. A7-Y]MCW7539484.1 DMT family transporter [Aquabacterium sp. A7-Y]